MTEQQMIYDGVEWLFGGEAGKALSYLWRVEANQEWPRSVREIYTNCMKPCSRTKFKRILDWLTIEKILGREAIAGRGGKKYRYWPLMDRKSTVVVQVRRIRNELQQVADIEGVELEDD